LEALGAEKLPNPDRPEHLNLRSLGRSWSGENHAFFSNLLINIDPTFIPHKFGILDFGFKVFCQLNKIR
jgi:hypothetical protein